MGTSYPVDLAAYMTRLRKARKGAHALLDEFVRHTRRPVHEVVFVLLRRATSSADAVDRLYKDRLFQDAFAVARVALESMLYAVYIVCDDDPKSRALQYLDLCFWATLKRRHQLFEEICLPVPQSPDPRKTTKKVIAENIQKAKHKLPEGYHKERWPPKFIKELFEELGLSLIHRRHYDMECGYAHPDPSMWSHFTPVNPRLDSDEEKEMSGSGALQVGIGSLEILCGVAEMPADRKGTGRIKHKRADILDLVKCVFLPADGRLLGDQP